MENPYPPRSATQRLPQLGSPPPPPPPQRPKRKIAAVAVPLVAAVIGGAVALGGAAVTGNLGGDETTLVQEARTEPAVQISPQADSDPERSAAEAEAEATAEPPDQGEALSVQEIVRRTSPAVVEVIVGGQLSELTGGVAGQRALGSGFVIDDSGHILTNQHVVDGAETVTVRFEDGTASEARVLGEDASTDLAVVKVDALPSGVSPVPLGDSGNLDVGDPVVALGSPLGQAGTATTGIVSALERIITSPNGFDIQNAIQTDAAINQGNSGGPLFDRSGRVIGINSQIATNSGGSDGIGFAVPIDTVEPIAASIIRGGTPEHAWIGISGRPLNPPLAERLGLGDQRGVIVVTVDERSPGKEAGLASVTNDPDAEVPEGGDIIVAVDGKPITDMANVSQAVSSKAVGDEITLTVLRDGQREDITFALGDRPEDVGIGRP